MNIVFESRASHILYNVLKNLDERIFLIPLNVCSIVPFVFFQLKKKFEFVDISASTLCIDHELVLDLIKKNPGKYGGVIYIRSYGYLSDEKKFFQELKNIDDSLFIIDDRALCRISLDFLNEDYFSDLVLYSIGHAKYTDLGNGGIGLFKKEYIYTSTELNYTASDEEKRFYNIKEENSASEIFKYINNRWLGQNFNGNNLPFYINIISEQTQKTDDIKKEINEIYKNDLQHISLSEEYQNWRYNILIDNKDLLLEDLFKSGLYASSHYKPLNEEFRTITHTKIQNKSISYSIYTKMVNLFNDKHYDIEKANKTVEIIKKHLKGNK